MDWGAAVRFDVDALGQVHFLADHPLHVAKIAVPAPDPRPAVRCLVHNGVVGQAIEVEEIQAVSLHQEGVATQGKRIDPGLTSRRGIGLAAVQCLPFRPVGVVKRVFQLREQHRRDVVVEVTRVVGCQGCAAIVKPRPIAVFVPDVQRPHLRPIERTEVARCQPLRL